MGTFKQLVTELSEAFETRKRDDGTEFVCRKDDAPEWMRDICLECHGDMFPDDWRYRFISEAADAIVENGAESGDEAHEAYESLPEYIYYHEGHDWLASGHGRAEYADRARSEYGIEGTDDSILAGMRIELEEVLYQLADAIEAISDDDDSAD